ncbi:MAG: restriction endonuclease subunit S [Clostridia bacterium]|nr:restriction endonuclease subunit S [Clostridia bacterium]
MSKLDELIKQYCPEGVEYKELWEVTAWDKRFNEVDNYKQKKVISYPYVLANKFKEIESEKGNVRLLSTGNYIGFTTEELADENLCEGEIIAIPWGGKLNIKYFNGKFVTADNRIATSLDRNVLSNKFLYYCMLIQSNKIQSFYRGGGIQHPSMKQVLELRIPIPPIQVQEEIVRILDKFANFTAELEAELESRKKQYEYYRNKLLDFSETRNKLGGVTLEWKKLSDICKFYNGKGHEKNISISGNYIVVNSKFVSTNGEVKKYSDSQLSPVEENDILMVMSDLPNGRALAKCYIAEISDKYTLNQRIGGFTIKSNSINSKYLYYILNRNEQLLSYDNGVDQTNLRKDDILKIKIPIPPILVQERIVAILDKFDKLVNDITNEGLPAEIEKRKQQYEYYRNKLLTFKELKK